MPWWLTFGAALPIALVGGLVGVGGAECRLPLLAGPLRHPLRHAVPLNLAVSLVTLVAALAVRLPSTSPASLGHFAPIMLAITMGAIIAASVGVNAVHRFAEVRLTQTVVGLLLLIGVLLMSIGFLPGRFPALVPDALSAQISGGLVLGLLVGGISSVLGVAGGAVLIPGMIFAYGLDITTAGTCSLIMSLPIVVIGIARFARRGAYQSQSLRRTVAPMGASSVIGAMTGGHLSGVVPAPLLAGGLGALIIWAAWRTLAHTRRQRCESVRP
jgi:uncharacterized membrane protein YfcA